MFCNVCLLEGRAYLVSIWWCLYDVVSDRVGGLCWWLDQLKAAREGLAELEAASARQKEAAELQLGETAARVRA